MFYLDAYCDSNGEYLRLRAVNGTDRQFNSVDDALEAAKVHFVAGTHLKVLVKGEFGFRVTHRAKVTS